MWLTTTFLSYTVQIGQPGIERVQALADISLSGYVVSAQLEGTPTIPNVTSGSVNYGAGMRQGTDRRTHTQTRVANKHFASSATHTKCN